MDRTCIHHRTCGMEYCLPEVRREGIICPEYEQKEKRRKKLSKTEREYIYGLFNGHCAYCGCEIAYKDMQVDHIVSLKHNDGKDELENMLPACRSCNHYKSTLTVEHLRKCIEDMPRVLMRDSVTFKNAVRYGLVVQNPKPVVFYFERMDAT
ncbi:MAG: HNH endonuclease signature motif containing protein [Angelakisella sp.]